MKKKIIIIFGTRPEAIKLCPLIIELKNRIKFDVIVCVTGQHDSMLDQVLNVFHIVPDYNLSIMKDKQSLFDITTTILTKIKIILDETKPHLCIVQGDTTTAFAAALSSFYLQIPIAHVEAGLRTYNIYSPYPEEFNRRAISLISSINFAPTEYNKNTLIKDGVNHKNIFVTGNTVIDAMKYTIKNNYYHPELDWVGNNKMILITAHRRENLGTPMINMFRAIIRVLNENPDVRAIYPIHMNPLIRQIAKNELGNCKQIHIIEPLNIIDCHNFESRCYLCLTDSGGIQEECPSYGKPVLVMRDTTERQEGLIAGTSRLVGTNEESIYTWFSKLLNDKSEYNKMSCVNNPYGDGHSCRRIVDILENNT